MLSQFLILNIVMTCVKTLPETYGRMGRGESSNWLRKKLQDSQKKTKMYALYRKFTEDNTNRMSQVCDVGHTVYEASCTRHASPEAPTSTDSIYCESSYSRGRQKCALCEPQSNFLMSTKKPDIWGYNITIQSKYVGYGKVKHQVLN